MTEIMVPAHLVRDPQRFGGVERGDCLVGKPVIKDRRLVGMTPPTGPGNAMVLPKLVEPHCHLDKCHTISRLGQIGGDLIHAITRQSEDKAKWTEDDIRDRTHRGLSEARAAGCGLIRTHVDWNDTAAPPLAWSVLQEVAEDDGALQCAVLTGIDQWTDPDFALKVAQIVDASNGVLGAFVLDHGHVAKGLTAIFQIASDRGLMLDFHVDEGLGAFNGLEAIADAAIAQGFEGPILCGHAVSLMDRDAPALSRIIDKLLQARITICALPITNLYLQGRVTGTPDRRGITRLRELRDAGVPVIVGSDNVGDAFCPLGAHDPMAALALACVTAHLDPPLGQWLPAVTTDAAAALGSDPVYVDGAQLTDLLICDATHTADLVSGRAPLIPAKETLQ